MFVLPFNRDARPAGMLWVTYVLIGVNSILWMVPAFMGLNGEWIEQYGFRPGAASWETMFASMFLHVGLLHVAGNMWFLWMFAPKVEERLGPLCFTLAYLVCGMGGAGLHMLLSPGSLTPCVGASGAISGVAGMYFLLFPRSPFELVLYLGWWVRKGFRMQTRGAVGAWIGEQLLLGVLTRAMGGGASGVAFWAYVGGFGTGLLAASMVLPRASREEREAVPRHAPLTEDEKDEIFADRVKQPPELISLRLND